jgi:hypothetical protein
MNDRAPAYPGKCQARAVTLSILTGIKSDSVSFALYQHWFCFGKK